MLLVAKDPKITLRIISVIHPPNRVAFYTDNIVKLRGISSSTPPPLLPTTHYPAATHNDSKEKDWKKKRLSVGPAIDMKKNGDRIVAVFYAKNQNRTRCPFLRVEPTDGRRPPC